MNIIDCLVECEIAESKAEAYRLLQARAIKVDNKVADKSFVFCCQVASDSWRPLDVKSIEVYEWPDWYRSFCSGEFNQDVPFRTLGRLIDLIGVKSFNKQDFAASEGGTLTNMILSETFLISRGKMDYWIVRLSETGPEIDEKLMEISLDSREQVADTVL